MICSWLTEKWVSPSWGYPFSSCSRTQVLEHSKGRGRWLVAKPKLISLLLPLLFLVTHCTCQSHVWALQRLSTVKTQPGGLKPGLDFSPHLLLWAVCPLPTSTKWSGSVRTLLVWQKDAGGMQSEDCAGLCGPLRAGWAWAPLGSQGHSSYSSVISTHSPALLGGRRPLGTLK